MIAVCSSTLKTHEVKLFGFRDLSVHRYMCGSKNSLPTLSINMITYKLMCVYHIDQKQDIKLHGVCMIFWAYT